MQYYLDKSSKKFDCPNCHKRRYVRYIDNENGNYMPINYGRCDRESKCSYHLSPYSVTGYTEIETKPIKIMKQTFIPADVLQQTLSGYEQNTFIQNLLQRVAYPFEVADIENVIAMYNVGTVKNGYRKGAVTFPFIDIKGNIRAIQVKQFNSDNHTTGTDFIHSIIEKHHTLNNKKLPQWLTDYKENDIKVSCLFGEHLLTKHNKPVALVEAPKTAIYGTLYMPGFVWLAVYNLSSLNVQKCRSLKGRDVYLFPDLSPDGAAFKLWSDKAKEIEKAINARFVVSDLLEKIAPDQDKSKGYDLADYLIKFDWRLFRTKLFTPQQEPTPLNVDYYHDLKYFDSSINVDGEPLYDFIRSRVHDVREHHSNAAYQELILLQKELFKNKAMPKPSRVSTSLPAHSLVMAN